MTITVAKDRTFLSLALAKIIGRRESSRRITVYTSFEEILHNRTALQFKTRLLCMYVL